MSSYEEIPVVDEVCISYTCNRLFEEINEEQKYANVVFNIKRERYFRGD